MAEISNFDVILDESEKTYLPGESVHGTVKLKVTKGLKLKEIKLECFGEAEVTWPVWSGTYTKYCYNRQTYLDLSAVLFPTKDSTDPALQSHLQQPVDKNGYQVLPSGDYSFTFYMVIPSDQNLPPSLEEKFGHIRYWFRGVIKRGRGRTDIKTSGATWKIGDVSLEDFEEEMNPIELHQRKVVGWPCCAAGELELSLTTNKGAYYPGDVIHFSFAMENSTSRDAAEVQVVLTRRVVYISSEDAKFSNSDEVEQISIGCVRSRDQILYEDVSLTIPATVQPTVYNSECIALLYYLQVNVKFDGKTKNSSRNFIHVPIVSACAKTNPVTNSWERSGKAFYDAQSKRDSKESLFWVTGTPNSDKIRSQMKNPQSAETQTKTVEANGKLVNKASKSEIKLRPFNPSSNAVPQAKQQLHQLYKISEYL